MNCRKLISSIILPAILLLLITNVMDWLTNKDSNRISVMDATGAPLPGVTVAAKRSKHCIQLPT